MERTARPQEICVFLHPGNIIPLLLLKKIPLFLIQTGHFLLLATGKGVLSQPLYNFKIAHNTATKITQIIYRKIPKINPGAYIFQPPLFEGLSFGEAYFRRGLSTEGNLRLKIDWASLIVGSKFIVFALFYFVFEGNFPITSPRGAYIWRGDLTKGFLRYWFWRLIFEGAYT